MKFVTKKFNLRNIFQKITYICQVKLSGDSFEGLCIIYTRNAVINA